MGRRSFDRFLKCRRTACGNITESHWLQGWRTVEGFFIYFISNTLNLASFKGTCPKSGQLWYKRKRNLYYLVMSLKVRVDDIIDNIVFLIKEYLEGFSESWLSNCSLMTKQKPGVYPQCACMRSFQCFCTEVLSLAMENCWYRCHTSS